MTDVDLDRRIRDVLVDAEIAEEEAIGALMQAERGLFRLGDPEAEEDAQSVNEALLLLRAIRRSTRPLQEVLSKVDSKLLWDELARRNYGLAEAKAEIGRLRVQLQRECAEAKVTLSVSEKLLAEAKAGADEIRRERDEARLDLGLWWQANKQLMADAEIGQLVRGMREHTSLYCIATGSAPNYYQSKTHLFAGSRLVSGTTNDPAEALRAIQKEVVGDA